MRTTARLITVGLVAALAVSCNTQRVRIAGQSMSPTLKDGERVTIARGYDKLERGDIVALKYPRDTSKSFVQRIVGLPGEEISSTEGVVFVNGRKVEEPYVLDGNRFPDTWGPTKIAAGAYFVMGDNRGNSSDSRSWGTVKQELIWAKVLR